MGYPTPPAQFYSFFSFYLVERSTFDPSSQLFCGDSQLILTPLNRFWAPQLILRPTQSFGRRFSQVQGVSMARWSNAGWIPRPQGLGSILSSTSFFPPEPEKKPKIDIFESSRSLDLPRASILSSPPLALEATTLGATTFPGDGWLTFWRFFGQCDSHLALPKSPSRSCGSLARSVHLEAKA
jgi:hypothetical protein